jgi:hypothetical protein
VAGEKGRKKGGRGKEVYKEGDEEMGGEGVRNREVKRKKERQLLIMLHYLNL